MQYCYHTYLLDFAGESFEKARFWLKPLSACIQPNK